MKEGAVASKTASVLWQRFMLCMKSLPYFFIGNCDFPENRKKHMFTEHMLDKHVSEHEDKTVLYFRRYKNLPHQPRHQTSRFHLTNNPYRDAWLHSKV